MEHVHWMMNDGQTDGQRPGQQKNEQQTDHKKNGESVQKDKFCAELIIFVPEQKHYHAYYMIIA